MVLMGIGFFTSVVIFLFNAATFCFVGVVELICRRDTDLHVEGGVVRRSTYALGVCLWRGASRLSEIRRLVVEEVQFRPGRPGYGHLWQVALLDTAGKNTLLAVLPGAHAEEAAQLGSELAAVINAQAPA